MRAFLLMAAAWTAAGFFDAVAAAEPSRIGVLFWHESENDLTCFRGIRRGLRAAGIDALLDEQHVHRDEAAARAHLRRWREEPADLVLAMGTRAALLAAEEVTDVPIVFAAVTNPVAAGLIGEDGLSGRNLTGASNMIFPRYLLAGFADAVPGLRRLGVLYHPENPVSRYEVDAARVFLAGSESSGAAVPVPDERAVHPARVPPSDPPPLGGRAREGGEESSPIPPTPTLPPQGGGELVSPGTDDSTLDADGHMSDEPTPAADGRERRREEEEARLTALRARLALDVRPVRDAAEVAAAAADLAGRCDALWVPIDDFVCRELAAVQAACRAARIPLCTSTLQALPAAVYGVTVEYEYLGLQAADLIRRVLREGADPARLPVRVASWFQTIVNLQAADDYGWEVPLAALCNAERILPRAGGAARDR